MKRLALAALMASSMVAPAHAQHDTRAADARALVAAEQLANAAIAGANYIARYREALLGAVPVGGAVTVSFEGLKAAGMIDPGATGVNPFGQQTAMVVRQPVAGQLEALVMTFAGQPITSKTQLARIASLAGPAGGFIDGVNIRGTAGGWELPVSAYASTGIGQSGYLAANVDMIGFAANAVRRSGPDGGKVDTSIVTQDVTNVGNITANTITTQTIVANTATIGTVTANQVTQNGVPWIPLPPEPVICGSEQTYCVPGTVGGGSGSELGNSGSGGTGAAGDAGGGTGGGAGTGDGGGSSGGGDAGGGGGDGGGGGGDGGGGGGDGGGG